VLDLGWHAGRRVALGLPPVLKRVKACDGKDQPANGGTALLSDMVQLL